VARSLADDPRRVLVPAEHALKGGIPGDVHDPHRQRDLAAPHTTTRQTLSVPPIRDVVEQSPDA
jgi:hypothetical protein